MTNSVGFIRQFLVPQIVMQLSKWKYLLSNRASAGIGPEHCHGMVQISQPKRRAHWHLKDYTLWWSVRRKEMDKKAWFCVNESFQLRW